MPLIAGSGRIVQRQAVLGPVQAMPNNTNDPSTTATTAHHGRRSMFLRKQDGLGGWYKPSFAAFLAQAIGKPGIGPNLRPWRGRQPRSAAARLAHREPFHVGPPTKKFPDNVRIRTGGERN